MKKTCDICGNDFNRNYYFNDEGERVMKCPYCKQINKVMFDKKKKKKQWK